MLRAHFPISNSFNSNFSAYTNVCSATVPTHSGWLLLKWSAIGLEFNGAETNCKIAHILVIVLVTELIDEGMFSMIKDTRVAGVCLNFTFICIEDEVDEPTKGLILRVQTLTVFNDIFYIAL